MTLLLRGVRVLDLLVIFVFFTKSGVQLLLHTHFYSNKKNTVFDTFL